jgi:hypothetical protein
MGAHSPPGLLERANATIFTHDITTQPAIHLLARAYEKFEDKLPSPGAGIMFMDAWNSLAAMGVLRFWKKDFEKFHPNGWDISFTKKFFFPIFWLVDGGFCYTFTRFVHCLRHERSVCNDF